jgi:hypothetical protein
MGPIFPYYSASCCQQCRVVKPSAARKLTDINQLIMVVRSFSRKLKRSFRNYAFDSPKGTAHIEVIVKVTEIAGVQTQPNSEKPSVVTVPGADR